MEEKFYHPEKHVFSNEDDVLKLSVGEVQDSQIMQMISEDITRKDTEQLRRHFECLKEKYHDNIQYSAMYIKFVFSNVIQELFQERGAPPGTGSRKTVQVQKYYGNPCSDRR